MKKCETFMWDGEEYVNPSTVMPADMYDEDEIDNLPDVEFIYQKDGLLIPKKGLTTLVGPSGIGKSTVALHLALDMAQEMDVMYVAAEKSDLIKSRKQAWYKYHAKPCKKNLIMFARAERIAELTKDTEFVRVIKYQEPKVIFLDTVSRCMAGREENNGADMSAFLDGCELLSRECGNATIILVHHTGWGNEGRERGHTRIRDYVDCVYVLSRKDDVVTLKNVKQNGAPHTDDVQYKVHNVPLENGKGAPVLVYLGSKATSSKQKGQPKRSAESANERLVLFSLKDEKNGKKWSAIMNDTAIAKSTLSGVLKSLVEKGYVEQRVPQGPYVMTDTGKAVLSKAS